MIYVFLAGLVYLWPLQWLAGLYVLYRWVRMVRVARGNGVEGHRLFLLQAEILSEDPSDYVLGMPHDVITNRGALWLAVLRWPWIFRRTVRFLREVEARSALRPVTIISSEEWERRLAARRAGKLEHEGPEGVGEEG